MSKIFVLPTTDNSSLIPLTPQKKKRASRKDYQKEWVRRDPQKQKSTKLKNIYGITLVDYNTLLEKQLGVCAMCKKPPLGRHSSGKPAILHVDHCHTTGKVRGLLCFKCNTNLGIYEKTKEQCKEYLNE